MEEKPPVKRLGASGQGTQNDRGSLRSGSDGAGPSGAAGKSSFASRFRPKNFAKPGGPPGAAEGVKLEGPESQGAEPMKADLMKAAENDANWRRRGRRGRDAAHAQAEGDTIQVTFGGGVGDVQPGKKASGASGGGAAGAASSHVEKLASKQFGPSSAAGKRAAAIKAGKAGGDLEDVLDEEEDEDEVLCDMHDETEYFPGQLNFTGPPEQDNPPVGVDLHRRPPDEMHDLMQRLSFFQHPHQVNGQEQLTLWQLPNKLPIPMPADPPAPDLDLPGSSAAAAAAAEPPAPAGERPACLQELSPCKFGKLLVFKSGRMKMVVGDVPYLVQPGIPCAMRQEVALVSPSTRECIMLGDIKQRVIVTPDVPHILSGRPLPDWKWAEQEEATEGVGAAVGPARKAAAPAGASPTAAAARRRHVIESDEEDGEGAEGMQGLVQQIQEEEEEEEEDLGAAAMDEDEVAEDSGPARGSLTTRRTRAAKKEREGDGGSDPASPSNQGAGSPRSPRDPRRRSR